MITDLIDLNLLTLYDLKLKTQANILQKSTAYSLGEFVHVGNIYLKCITAGTTGSSIVSLTGVSIGSTVTDGTVTWEVFDPFSGSSGNGINNWQQNTVYAVDDIVVYGNGIYQCGTAHTSTSTFDDTKWINLSVGYDKNNLYSGTSFNNSSVSVTTSSSMLLNDFLIVKIAYSSDGINTLMNKSFFVVPEVNDVYDFSYFESTYDYIVISGEITSSTTFVFNFSQAYTIDNFKIVSIDGIVLGSTNSLASVSQIQGLF